MPDDQVTIDPQFQPPEPVAGQSRWLRLAAIGAVAAAAFILGWLLRSPTPAESEATAGSTSTTALTRATTSTTPPAATVAEIVGLSVPLGEAVPGFADTITMAVSSEVWQEEGFDVVRWRSSQAAPETIASFRHRLPDDQAWFAGLDAGGSWYALHDAYGVLSVQPVAAVTDDVGWPTPTGEAVGLRVASFSWHDTEPGRLAWVTCPRTPSSQGTLATLDVADDSAEPVPVASMPDPCGESTEAWIERWGDWGFALGRVGDQDGQGGFEEGHSRTVLLDPGGRELASLENGPGESADMVASGPAGTIWTEARMRGSSSSFLLSLDGQQRTPPPGLADGEWVNEAQWSPDGSRLALVPLGTQVAPGPSIRIVDATSGETVAEIEEPASGVSQPRWSSDGRFLLYGRDRGIARPEQALVVYDTAAATIAAEVPLPERHTLWEVRTRKAAPTAEEFTAVEWGISLEDSGPGVHTVFMIADVRPLHPDQVEDLAGRLVWDETIVDLCNITIRHEGGASVHIGDIFQTTEGCGRNRAAMQEAFDEFGLPDAGCVAIRSGGLDHEYCAPLSPMAPPP